MFLTKKQREELALQASQGVLLGLLSRLPPLSMLHPIGCQFSDCRFFSYSKELALQASRGASWVCWAS